jgi:hypothetical protein
MRPYCGTTSRWAASVSIAVLSAIVGFTHLVAGIDNRRLVALVQVLLDRPYTARQATYDLRRLRRKGVIERIPHSHRYQLTPFGRRAAVLFTKAYGRVLAAGFVELQPDLPHGLSRRSPLAQAWRGLERALDDYVTRQLIAACELDLTVNFVMSKLN